MIDQKILNAVVVNKIQKYLASMNWAQREYQGEKFCNFLEGVEYALWEKGIQLKLKSEYLSQKCSTEFWVEVWQYSDPTDCWSSKELLFMIYESQIE